MALPWMPRLQNVGVLIALSSSYSVVENLAVDPDDAFATFGLENDGDVYRDRFTNGYNDIGDWMTPKGGDSFSNYEVRATKNSGTNPTGSALSTWLNLGTTRSWTITRTTVGTTTCNLTVEIRNASTLEVLTSSSVTITATVNA